jgi:putative transposase
VSRSGYYKALQVTDKRVTDEQSIAAIVKRVRWRQERLGGKKIYSRYKQKIHKIDCRIGRDKFFDILRKHMLLVKPCRKYVYTTDSYHHFRVHKNQLKDKVLTKAHQAWVSDITYVRTSDGFMYLFLLTDAYSRKIVGWSLSRSLGLEGAIEALQMAIEQCGDTQGVIHHSDRGIQYCSHEYVRLLREAGIVISMTEQNHCYENAIAERVNGILKMEYGLERTFDRAKELLQATKEAIWLYNVERPHWSLGLCTPEEVHRAA